MGYQITVKFKCIYCSMQFEELGINIMHYENKQTCLCTVASDALYSAIMYFMISLAVEPWASLKFRKAAITSPDILGAFFVFILAVSYYAGHQCSSFSRSRIDFASTLHGYNAIRDDKLVPAICH
jgi:hypothetical protein